MNRQNFPALLLLSLLLLVGCSEPQREPQKSINHPSVNVVPVSPRPTSRPSARGDAVVVARLVSHREYATEPTDDRNWRRHWYLTKFDVLRVEQGKWADTDVRISTDNVWPTPESGIILDMGPDMRIPAAYPGSVWALQLDTTANPAKLVGYDERSLVPPHDKPSVRLLDSSPERYILPVKAYMASLGKEPNKDFYFGGIEQTDTAYVVQVVSQPEQSGHQSIWVIAVDKKMAEVKLLWTVP